MLGRSPDEVAKFLAKTTGLNKTMVGEYLGEREDMCLKVMHAYVDAMNFTGAQFDEAIRWDKQTLCESNLLYLCTCVSYPPGRCLRLCSCAETAVSVNTAKCSATCCTSDPASSGWIGN